MGLSNKNVERTKETNMTWLDMRKQWSENDAVRDKGLCEPSGIIKLRNLDYKAPFDNRKMKTMLEAENVKVVTGGAEGAKAVTSRAEDAKAVSGGAEVSDKPVGTRINCPDFASAEYVSSSLFDVYIPQTDKEKYPVILSVHGGGWFYGDKELYRFYCMDMAKRGFAVINMNYRLAPENIYPAAIEDVCLCVRYISEHAEALKLDMENFYMAGDSAGAQLVTNYSIIATNEAYRKMVDFETCDIVPKAVALNCGIYEMREIKGGSHDWYLYGKYPDKPECERTANEITEVTNCGSTEDDIIKKSDGDLLDLFLLQLDYMTDKFPPAYLMCSVNDALMVHTAAMKKKLEDLNIRHVYREYGQENSDSGHVFHLDLYNPEGRRCNDEEAEFFAYN